LPRTMPFYQIHLEICAGFFNFFCIHWGFSGIGSHFLSPAGVAEKTGIATTFETSSYAITRYQARHVLGEFRACCAFPFHAEESGSV